MATIFFVCLPFAAIAQNGNDPAVDIISPAANTCVNSGVGQDCQQTEDCVDLAKGGTGQSCANNDECNRTGVPCNAAGDCQAAGAGTTCRGGQCFFETQECTNDGRCFETCASAADCGEGQGHVCSNGRCYFTDYVCRAQKCVTENGIVGGEAVADPRDVPMTIELSDPRSRDLKLQFKAEWTLPTPTGRVCPTNDDVECNDRRLVCQQGQCVSKGCAVNDDCNECDNGICIGNLICENNLCAQRGSHAFEVGYSFPDTCQRGQPCAQQTDEFEFMGFLIGDSPATNLTVNIKEACDPIPETSSSCTSCQDDSGCGIGQGCLDGSCVELVGQNRRCGPGRGACDAGQVCSNGLCFQGVGVACDPDANDVNVCVPPGANAEVGAMYPCVRGECVELECLEDIQCVPNGQEADAAYFACLRGVCVDKRTTSGCQAGETCTNNRCLPTDLCETFDDVNGSVSFRLDRKAPTATIDSFVLEQTLSECTDSPNAIAGSMTIRDEQTQAVVVQELPMETEGCTVRRIVRVTDDCGAGNIKDIALETPKPVEAGQLNVGIEAYLCTPDGQCPTQEDGAQPIADGASVPSAMAVVRMDAELGCALETESTLINKTHYNGTCPDAEPEPTRSGFCLQCTNDEECGSGSACYQGVCVDLNKGNGACGPNLQACAQGSDCVDGVCLACPNGDCTNGGQPECEDSAQCGQQGACVRGVCINVATDLPCSSGEICRRGACIDPVPGEKCDAQTPCPNNGQCDANGRCVSCANDGECAGDATCVDGQCVTCSGDAECPGDQVCLQGSCYEPEQCTAHVDCMGSRYCNRGQCDSPCRIYTGDPVNEAGQFTVRVTAKGCGPGAGESDEVNFEILEAPQPRLTGDKFQDGVYRVQQGEALTLDASSTLAGGAITEFAWDINQDGYFEPGPGANACLGNADCRGDEVCHTDGMCRLLCANNTDCRENSDPAQICSVNEGFCRTEVFPGNNPRYTFDTDESGSHRVSLRVTDEYGAIARLVFTVEVEDVEPVCNLGGPYEVAEGTNFTFITDGIRAGHPADPIVAYTWDFGDGSQNTGREQNHIFDIDPNAPPPDNTYTVTLSVRDIDSPLDSPTTCQTSVKVLDVDPEVTAIDILNPQQQIEGQTVQFDGSARPGGARDPLERYRWTASCVEGLCETSGTWADRQVEGPQRSRVDWSFPEDGRYRICLSVKDEDPAWSPELCQEITIADISPIANIDGPQAGNQGDELAFNLRGTIGRSRDDELDRVVIQWGDDSSQETRSRQQLENSDYIVRHTYVQDGEKTITIRAIDEDSQTVATHVVLIRDAVPDAVITGPAEAIEGEEVELSALNSVPGSVQDPISEYRWDFGDGQTVVRQAGQQVVRHVFPDDRTYVVQLTVVDIDGSEATATHEIVVQNKAPKVTFSPQEGVTQVALGERIQFIVQSKDAPVPNDGVVRVIALVDDVPADLPPSQSMRVNWNLGDGTAPRPGTIVETTYDTLGRKAISVEITDGDLGTRALCAGIDGIYSEDKCTFVVQVTPAPPVIIVDEEVAATEGQELVFKAQVIAPLVGADTYGDLDIRTEGNLPGASVAVGELQTPDQGAPFKEVTVSWTPSYYEAPIIRPFQITAFANATSRTKAISVRVREGGSPRLATLGGRANLSQLTFYDYSVDPQSRQLRLTPTAPISLGLGVGALVSGPEHRYVWVTLPGSNHVAVVDSRTNGRGLVRRVPVGERPTAIAVGGQQLPDGARIWVANQGDNSISVIDPVTMKLDYRSADDDYLRSFELDGLDGPADMVWLPAGFGGLEDARLAIITRYSGHIALVDPQKVVNGELRPVVAKVQIGAVLNRIVADPVSGDLFVSDVKTRRIYRINASDLDENDNPEVNGISIPTAARDLAVNVIIDEATGQPQSTVVAALEDGLVEIDGDDVESYINDVTALTVVNEQAIVGGAIATMSRGGLLRHAQPADIQSSVPKPSSVPTGDRLVRRMIMLISPR